MIAETPAALLDANVLIPSEPRDTLLSAAEEGAWHVRWTERILAEMERNLVARVLRGNIADRAARASRTLAAMRRTFPNATITGYEDAIARMTNAPEDRHVTAAAWYAGVSTIVTFNLRDFPPAALAPFGLRAVHPDDFLLALFGASPEVFITVLREQVAARTRPRQTPQDVLTTLAHLTPRYAAALRERLL